MDNGQWIIDNADISLPTIVIDEHLYSVRVIDQKRGLGTVCKVIFFNFCRGKALKNHLYLDEIFILSPCPHNGVNNFNFKFDL